LATGGQTNEFSQSDSKENERINDGKQPNDDSANECGGVPDGEWLPVVHLPEQLPTEDSGCTTGAFDQYDRRSTRQLTHPATSK